MDLTAVRILASPRSVGIGTAGYFFGNLPLVKAHLDKTIWALIIVPGLIAIFGAWRGARASASATETTPVAR